MIDVEVSVSFMIVTMLPFFLSLIFLLMSDASNSLTVVFLSISFLNVQNIMQLDLKRV